MGYEDYYCYCQAWMCLSKENPREPLITDSEAVIVPDTTYYTRLIADGSLLKVKPNEQKKKKGDIADKSGDDK